MTDVAKSPASAAAPARRFNRTLERVALIIVWALLIAAFGAVMPQSFLSWGNFSIMFASYAPAALLALAIIVPLTAGDYDLSVGATMTLSSSVIGVLNVWHGMPIGWVLLVVIAIGVVIGLVHGLFIIFFRVPSLVVTLGTTSLMSGIVQWITNSSTIGGIDNTLIDAVVGVSFLGVPLAFYYALLGAVAMWYVFDYTPVGRKLLFVGRGREVARLNGIAVDLVRLGALIASAVLASIAGIVYAGVLGSADPYSGLNYLLPAFAAAFLGATTIMPGRFNSWGVLVAVLFLVTGITGLQQLGARPFVQNLFYGAALIVAVVLSFAVRSRRRKAA